MKTTIANSITTEEKKSILDAKLTEAQRRTIRRYAKAKRIEKQAKQVSEKLQPEILAIASKLPSNKLEYVTLNYQSELLAKIIFVELFTVDSAKLKTDFSEVYERVKKDSSNIQLRLA